jgi:hypothetical protein
VRSIRQRLNSGERWWAAELVLRLLGLALLGGSALAVRAVLHLTARQAGTPFEFVVALVAFVCLTTGLALLMAGPSLFRLMPMPPRALLP